jgi:two-component system, OmpR family, response regulator ChvI
LVRRVLIVDDEEDITDALKAGLEHRGFKVDTFNEPLSALEKFTANTYDIAILDIRMPKMNGFELYREMRKVDGKASVCFLTAFDVHRDEFEKMFPDVKVKAFLKKPITIDNLVMTLNKLVPPEAN